jgi:hypothetical protein
MRTITLEEWSGPVSPKHQWRITIAIRDLDVDYEETGAHAQKKHRKLSQDAADALWKDLDAKKAFTLGAAITERKVGVSFNTLTLERGAEKLRLEYTLAGATAAQKAVIDAIKKAARALS